MLRKVLVLLGLLILVPGIAQAEERLRNFHVLGFGINKYAAGPKMSLPSPVNDVATLADYLTRQDFESGKPRPDARLLYDTKAKKGDIERELNDLPNWVADGGTAAILYSGHGMRHGGHWYLVPHDMNANQPEDTGVSDTTILAAVDRLIEKRHCRVLMIMNSCNSGQLITAARPLFDKYHDPAKGGLIIMASSAPSEVTHGALMSSIFNSALNNGLKMMQAHVYPTNSVSIKEIRRFLQIEVDEQMRFWWPKPPGVEWPDQFALVECSLSIPETLGLTWADPKFTVKMKTSVTLDAPSPVVVTNTKTTKSPVGKWISLRPIVSKFDPVTRQPVQFFTDSKGKPIVEPMVLALDADGSYQVYIKDFFGKAQTGSGAWKIVGGNQFTMTFNTGVDRFTVEKIDDNSLELRKVGPAMNPSLMASIGLNQGRSDPVWRFSRVTVTDKK